MELAGWLVAILFGVLAVYLALRKPSVPVTPEAPSVDDTTENGAMQEMARYLEKAVIDPLEASLSEGRPGIAAQDAVDALRDLVEYAGVKAERADRTENLLAVLQTVTREYTTETRVPVRVRGPDRPVRVRIAPERFKDAVYLLLVNAGRFGGGTTVDVEVVERGGTAEVRVRDKGPGFSAEALMHAFKPFWTSEDDALGLGLPHARRLMEAQDGTVSVGNAEGGGAEAVVTVRKA